MISNIFKIAAIVLLCGVAKADPFCTDFSGTFRSDAAGLNLEIAQTACELIQTTTSMSSIAPKLRQLALNNVPVAEDNQLISGRMAGEWMQIQVEYLLNGELHSTLQETFHLITKDRLELRVKNFDNTGLQDGPEYDFELTRIK